MPATKSLQELMTADDPFSYGLTGNPSAELVEVSLFRSAGGKAIAVTAFTDISDTEGDIVFGQIGDPRRAFWQDYRVSDEALANRKRNVAGFRKQIKTTEHGLLFSVSLRFNRGKDGDEITRLRLADSEGNQFGQADRDGISVGSSFTPDSETGDITAHLQDSALLIFNT